MSNRALFKGHPPQFQLPNSRGSSNNGLLAPSTATESAQWGSGSGPGPSPEVPVVTKVTGVNFLGPAGPPQPTGTAEIYLWTGGDRELDGVTETEHYIQIKPFTATDLETTGGVLSATVPQLGVPSGERYTASFDFRTTNGKHLDSTLVIADSGDVINLIYPDTNGQTSATTPNIFFSFWKPKV